MKQPITYFFIRTVLLVTIMLVLSWIYRQFFWQTDLDRYGGQLEEVIRKADSCDVLYFAESSNATYADSDTNRMSISELFAVHYPGKIIGSINKGAVHAGVYLPLIRQIPETAKVRTIIVTMNLRSFDASWINSQLETPLMKSNVMYGKRDPFISKLMMSFGFYDNKSKAERDREVEYRWRHDILHFPFEYPYRTVRAWDDAFANGYYTLADGSWDMPKIELACHYIKTYAFQIDTVTNPRISDFDEIVKVAQKKKLQLVFNLMAENVEYADSLVGKPLTYLMKQNRDLLVNRYRGMGATVVDNLERVAGYNYMDQHWTTEHYFYEGRRQIADQLALHVKIP